MVNSVEFDPGIGNLVQNLYSEVYVIERDLASMPQKARKTRYFQAVYKRLVKVIINNLAFYNGCLAWAYYIKETAPDAILSSNPFISLTEEQKANYAPTETVDFFIEYLPQFYSNLKYYNVKDTVLPENTDLILSLYREFVASNEGFINANKVSDIILPEHLKFNNSAETIKEKINSTIDDKDLTPLLDL